MSRPSRSVAFAFLGSRLLVWVAGAVSFHVLALANDRAGDVVAGGGTVGDTLAAPAARWDAGWYLDIAGHGYRREAIEPAFFPLYSILIRGLSEVVRSEVVAGVAISLAGFAVALVLLQRLTELELGPETAARTVVLLAFFPTALFFSAVYTEALFLALELGAFYAARRGHWAWAGVLGALGSATRNTGWLLAPVLLILYLYGPRSDAETPPTPGRSWIARIRPRHPLRPDVLWIALVPLGLVAYLAYMQVHFGDWLAPYHAQEYFQRTFDGPFSALWQGGEKAWDGLTGILDGSAAFGPALRKIAQFVVVCGALAAAVGVLRRLPAAYGAYTVLAIVPVLSFPYPPGPLASSLRYLVVIFPLFMWLGLVLRDPRAHAATVVVFALGLVYCAAMFATGHFVA
ncbi:MAG TPA: mannosyltransferase family protein [Solirubrobacteraceae bacterium]|nr:mannosyltransferase family protein [Solirubrobacteraceae bacterium]